MIDKAAPSLMRIYTAHDLVVYVDETTKELRHGPPEICPANAFFKLEDLSGEIVFLFGDHELPVDDRGDDGLAARVDRPPAFKPTKFEIIEVEYGLAGLRAGSHFLAAEPNGRIVTNRGHCLAWERFRLHAHQTLDSERSEEAIAHFNPAIPLGRGTTFNKQETYVGLPLVSFVVACYNQSKYINDLIDSILGQTVKDIELILVDDGSTDDTGELVRKYNDRRLIYIRQPNAGPSAAINRGLDFARADYIAFSGGDDVSCPERVETSDRADSRK